MKKNNIDNKPILSLPCRNVANPEARSWDITAFRFRTFDRSSKLYHSEEADPGHFDDRSDQMMLKHMAGVAVMVEVANLEVLAKHRRSARVFLVAELMDVTADSIVASRSVNFRMRRDEPYRKTRLDFSFPYLMANSAHTYRIILRDLDSDETLGSRTLRFFDLPLIKMLPTRWFTTKEAWVKTVAGKVEISLDMECASREIARRVPELRVELVSPDGSRMGKYAIPQLSAKPGDDTFILTVEFDRKIDTEGISLIEVRSMGYPIVGCLVNGRALKPSVTRYSKMELAPFKVYSPYKAWKEYVTRRRKFIEDLFGEGWYDELTDDAVAPWRREERDESEFTPVLPPCPEPTAEDLKFTPDPDIEFFMSLLGKGTKVELDFSSSAEETPQDDENQSVEEISLADDLTDEEEESAERGAIRIDDCEDDESACISREDSSAESDESADEELSVNDMLDALTGLEEVKERISRYAALNRFMQKRREAGMVAPALPLHALFLGSPGTGKTTVGKIMGRLLKDAGVLSKGHVVYKERASLLGQNYNSESEKTLEAIREAQGGVLFIDEAYQLFQPNDPRDPGKFVLETLMTVLADESMRDWMLILAGYADPLKKMLEMNPGLASRFPQSNWYTFEDFTPQQLVDIAEGYFRENQFRLTPDAWEKLRTTIQADYDNRPDNFGNGRYVMNLITTQLLPSVACRVMEHPSPDETMLRTIEASDIPSPSMKREEPRRRSLGFRA